MSVINDVVFVHGWGLNKAVFSDYIQSFKQRFPSIAVHTLDVLGYGDLAHENSTADLEALAKSCLDQAPKHAVWVGWSLGGMIAMQAALFDLIADEPRIQGLQLINSTPKFVQSSDWPSGVDIAIFRRFSADLARDYNKTLSTFLLLQAGSSKGARQLAREAEQAVSQYANPSEITLSKGIDCLANSDLREALTKLKITTQVVLGSLDRVTRPESSVELAKILGAQLVEIKSGHAPFMTHKPEMLDAFESLLQSIESQV